MTQTLRVLALSALIGLGGCATHGRTKSVMKENLFSDRPLTLVHDVPFIKQTHHLCGPTALYMVTKTHHPTLQLDEVIRLSLSPHANGTYKQDLLSAARRLGMAPYRVRSLEDMIDVLSSGSPILVFHQARFMWREYWHYSVLTGFDQRKWKFFVHIGAYPHREMDITGLVRSWNDGGSWAFVISGPAQIPEQADFEEALSNSQAFLRLGQNGHAFELAQVIQKRWPDRYEADVVFAESQLRRGDHQKALRTLKQALRKMPGNDLLRRKVVELSSLRP